MCNLHITNSVIISTKVLFLVLFLESQIIKFAVSPVSAPYSLEVL